MYLCKLFFTIINIQIYTDMNKFFIRQFVALGFVFGGFFGGLSAAAANDTIAFTWQGGTVYIAASNGKNFTVYWGDNASDAYTGTGASSSLTVDHTYAAAGTYTVTIAADAGCNFFVLKCSGNGLSALNVTKSTALTFLNCDQNALTNLDVTKNTALTYLSCSWNDLTNLDVSKCTALTGLRCVSNALTSLDVHKCTALTGLRCVSNDLTNLDVSNCTSLAYLDCIGNSLTNLDVRNCTALTELYCFSNSLTNLDVTKNTALTELSCSNNSLTNLDVSKNTALTDLYCSFNSLTNLDVSKNTALNYLTCYHNSLTNLDVSNCTVLTYLDCCDNSLTSLDVSNCTALTYLYCYNNHLPLSALYAASKRISYQDLGTQTLLPQTVGLYSTADFSAQAKFGTPDTLTAFTTPTKNGSPASASDYSLTNGIFTFKSVGTYVVTMTNAAIKSSSYYPAKVTAEIDVVIPLCGGDGLSAATAYQICTPEGLKYLSDCLLAGDTTPGGGYYKLMDDIDLSAYGSTYNGGKGWNPIGNSATPFRGNFDGNNKVVRNLTINRPTESYVGLFGYVVNAKIEKLGVTVAYGDSVKGKGYVGCLIGYSNNSSIKNCRTAGNIIGVGNEVGGLVGHNGGNSIISNCYSNCNVTQIGGNYNYGGLVGLNNNSIIENSYATGNVNAFASAGGLAGANQTNAIVRNCYATSNVTGTANTWNYAGLVGYNENSTITNCYARGKIIGYNQVGGLVGDNFNGIIKNCIAANDSVISTLNTAVNRIVSKTNNPTVKNNYVLNNMVVMANGSPLPVTSGLNTTAGMDTNMLTLQQLAFYTNAANWDTTTWSIDSAAAIWKICDGESFPFLRWQGIYCSYEVDTIKAIAGAGGSISPSGAIVVVKGDNKTFTFYAYSGYKIDQVLIDGVNNPSAASAGTYTFTNVQADHKIEVSFKSTVGVETITNDDPRITVYPNPTNGQLTIASPNPSKGGEQATIEIYNVVGQVVFMSQLSKLSPETTIDISHLANGMYFLKVDGKVFKVVKE